MIRLSVNVNKIATIRNSRGGREPRILDAVEACLRAGAAGITVHPRADQRHITPGDVCEIAAALVGRRPQVELNIEGDPRPDWIDLVHDVRPDQATLVPVIAGEITSQAGWRPEMGAETLRGIVHDLKSRGIRVSLFVDPTLDAVRFASNTGADRIELYTEPFARAFEQGSEAVAKVYRSFVDAAEHAHAFGLGVNAGHDLDLDNLTLFRELPYLEEVSIGHAIISRAVFEGLETVVRQYLAVLAGGGHQKR